MGLDVRDIEDLGWKLKEKKTAFNGKPCYIFIITKESGFNTGTEFTLQLLEDLIIITTQGYSSWGGGRSENMGFKLQDKLELKKLMKQLGI